MSTNTDPTQRRAAREASDGAAGPLRAIVLAAGKGTRMGSDLPKVMHEIAGEPMVRHVVRACVEAGCDRVVVVVGYGQQLVREALADFPQVQFAVQDEQLGTGHAVRCAQSHFETDRSPDSKTGGSIEEGDVFVLCGDGPLIRTETLGVLLDRHRAGGPGQSAAATLATSVIADPTGYGRVVRDEGGQFVEIVEQKVATPEQLAICEVNPSYYCFQSDRLFWALERVERNETSGEYYVTDAPRILLEAGHRVEVVDAVPPEDVLSINTIEELARVNEVFLSHRANASPASAPARVEGDDR